jgi:hypothetical protein
VIKVGAEDKKKLPILIVVGVGAIGAMIWIYSQLSTPNVPATTAAPVVVTPTVRATTVTAAMTSGESAASGRNTGLAGLAGAGKQLTGSAQYDPTLKMDGMLVAESLVYTGSGRNIFSANSAPVAIAIPVAKFPARPVAAAATIAAAPTGPPPPPPINLKFFGTDTGASGARQAFLLHGDDVYVASTGDIVQRRYRIGTISANSIEVEDLANNNKQMLPLQR